MTKVNDFIPTRTIFILIEADEQVRTFKWNQFLVFGNDKDVTKNRSLNSLR